MFELKIINHISSAHFLRGYEGKCKNLHGHTWKIEVILKKESLDGLGMVADFAKLKKDLKDFLEHLDHTTLNDMDIFKSGNPTAENIAKYIYQGFSKVVAPLSVKSTTVWESDCACATYYE